MSPRHPVRSSYRPAKLTASLLEDRWLPSQSPVGPLVRPYTFSEVMATIRSTDPLGDLQSWSAVGSDSANSRVIHRMGDAALVEVALVRGADPLATIAALQVRPEVAWAEPNFIYIGDPREFTPDDPQYGSQYHHTKMQNDKAWDFQTGNPAISVAILDDGVALGHPDLAANLWSNSKETPGNSIDDDGNGVADDLIGWDFSAGDADANPVASDTHGTHVAGIVAARTNNATGVAGVAGGGINGDGARIMAVRWYGSGSWTSSVIAQSYTYAANSGARIANASYNFDGWASGGVQNATVQSGLDYAYSKGVLMMNSAGNSGALDPARGIFDQVLFVASSDSADAKSSFSNYGQFVDITAPGSSILATTTNTDGTVFTYGNLSGTSMSTPDAAGVAALVWSHHPTWTRDQVAAQLLYATDNIDAVNPSYIGGLGTGRANSYKAVTQTLPPPKFAALVGLPAANGVTPAMPATFYLDAPMRFDPATVTASKFELRSDGADGAFDTGDDVIIPITLNNGSAYRIGVGRLNFTVTGSAVSDRYRFKASAGLLDPFGQALDGNSNGVGGDDFSRTFFVARQIEGRVFEDRNNDGLRDASEPNLANRTVYLDTNGDGNFNSSMSTYVSTNVPAEILDYSTTTSSLNVAGFVGSVTDVNLKLSLTHTYDADLTAFLIGPTGATITLFANVGGSGDNFSNTVLDDQAATAITAGSAPFTGSFRPAGALTAFNNLNPNGVWTLQIDDDYGVDEGSLTAWSLDITTAEPNSKTDASGVYWFSNLSNGNYAVRHVLPSGWNAGVGPAGGVHNITITSPTDQNPERNFGELAANTIYGRFYNDTNYSGGYNTGEALLANWRAYLDSNGNSSYDVGEPTSLSAADGTYAISSVAAGSHTLRRVLQGGFTATQPAAGSYPITMASGQSMAGRDFGQSNAPPPVSPTVTALKVNGTTGGQRSNVFSIVVDFSETVTFSGPVVNAFTLTRKNAPLSATEQEGINGLVNITASPATGSTNSVTLTFLTSGANPVNAVANVGGASFTGSSLPDGTFDLKVLSSLVTGAGGNLDGDTVTPGLQDFNRIGSVNPLNDPAGLYRLFGDVTGDGTVSNNDFNLLKTAFSSGPNAAFDYNNDGDVANNDFNQLTSRFGGSLP